MRKPVCDSFAAAEDGPLARSRSVAQSGLCPALQDRFHGRFDAGSAPGLLVGAVPGIHCITYKADLVREGAAMTVDSGLREEISKSTDTGHFPWNRSDLHVVWTFEWSQVDAV